MVSVVVAARTPLTVDAAVVAVVGVTVPTVPPLALAMEVSGLAATVGETVAAEVTVGVSVAALVVGVATVAAAVVAPVVTPAVPATTLPVGPEMTKPSDPPVTTGYGAELI